jgi:hypothetical protein
MPLRLQYSIQELLRKTPQFKKAWYGNLTINDPGMDGATTDAAGLRLMESYDLEGGILLIQHTNAQCE